MQNFSETFFFRRFFTSFDRPRAANHENLLFSLGKYFLPSGRKRRNTRKESFFEKNTILRNMQNFLLHPFFQLLNIIFLDSVSKTEYKKVVKLTPGPKLLVLGLRIMSSSLGIGRSCKSI